MKRPTKTDKPVGLATEAMQAAIGEARRDFESSIESARYQFENTPKGLVATIPIATGAAEIAMSAKPFYAQVGNIELPDDYGDVPFTYINLGGRTVQLYQGYRSAFEQMAKALSEYKDSKLPHGSYRYALMLWREPQPEKK